MLEICFFLSKKKKKNALEADRPVEIDRKQMKILLENNHYMTHKGGNILKISKSFVSAWLCYLL